MDEKNKGELKKRIEDFYATTDVFCDVCKWEFLKILDEAKQEIFDIGLSVVDYPAEDYEARSIYEDKISRLLEVLEKWLGRDDER